MTSLTHRVTGHTVTAEAEHVEFWQNAGYREAPAKPAAKKAPAKKSAAKKS